MSGKLDKSLDEILSNQRRSGGPRRRNPRRAAAGKPAAAAAPVGGIQKNKPARNTAKPAPAKALGSTGESKIMVSNLPKDVSEAQIKDYFQQAVGGVKRVEIAYGPGGISRGNAHVLFHQADKATKAFNQLNGLLIDGRPVKVEVIVANAELLPQPKSLAQRLSQPKVQPKSAAAVKHAAGAKAGTAGKPDKKALRKGRAGRPKKTAEELDSEMTDYFANANANGENAPAGAPAATNGDAPMEDEIL